MALVIEWNNDDAETAATLASPKAPSRTPAMMRKLATIVGALGAIILTTWGLRRLGMAS